MKGNRMGKSEIKTLKKQVTIGVIFIVIGCSFLLNDYIVFKREETFSKMNLELSELLAANNPPKEENSNDENTSEEKPEEVVEANTTNDYETYVGILEIPKIGFNKGFYKKESSLNNVKFNIKILDVSDYPDVDKGNVIIIGHSGNYSNSYFGNLYQLERGDQASITYEDIKYTYKIVDIYTQDKDGTVTVYRDETKTTLTLITCTKDDERTQTIYIFELIDE